MHIKNDDYEINCERYNIKGAKHGNAGVSGKPGSGSEQGNNAWKSFHVAERSMWTKVLTLGVLALKPFNFENFENFNSGKDSGITSNSGRKCHNTGSGIIPTENNSKLQIQPQKSKIDFYSNETEYLKFISNLELKESKLQERDFCKTLFKKQIT